MQLLFDFFPIIAFFIAYKLSNIYVATVVIIIASIVQIAVHWFRTHTVNKLHVISAVLLILFGGITLYLQNKLYIQWKPTVLYWLFALVFLASQFFGEKMVIERMLDHAVTLERTHWRMLNSMWAIFFAVMGCANLYVVYHYDENTWVNFKMFGFLGLTLLFALVQGIWISGKVQHPDTEHAAQNDSATGDDS